MVLGHVDSVGSVEALYREKDDWRFMFSYPPAFHRYVVEKGSIAVDGISLTPFQVTDETFQCAVIPQTFKMTNLQYRAVGDPVNLEFDVLAKYVERVMHRVH
jgi:riboflavin synthase